MPCMMQQFRFQKHAELLIKEKELYLQMWSIIKNINIHQMTPEYWEDIKQTRNFLIELNETYVIEEDQQTVQTVKNVSIFMGDNSFLKILQKNKNYFIKIRIIYIRKFNNIFKTKTIETKFINNNF